MGILDTIVEKVVEKVVDTTVAPIARQGGYLIFYKDNFKVLKDQVEELQRERESISHEVEAEKRNGREIYDVVLNWLNRVDEITEIAKQLSDDPRHRNVGCSKWSFPNLKSRHQLSRKAKKMATIVAEVMQGKNSIDRVAYLPALEGVGSTSTTKSSEKLESRKKMKEDIVLALRDPTISRIGVYGLGGVGKTTLVKEVAKQVKDDKLFDEVVMANVSQTPELEKIQLEIADFLGLRFEETSIVGRAKRLIQRIKKEKGILIILDDIWARLDLDKLGIPFEDEHKGCKLLLTSRNQDILQEMETKKDFMLNVLNEEETWSLFEAMVGDIVKDDGLHSLAVQVAQKCAGLTVLIATVARALKTKDINSWKDALNRLQTVDKGGINATIYSALEFSYNHLDGDEVKALFLLCGILGSQKFEYFLACAMGLGIFKDINTLEDARVRLHKLIGSLEASCLLLETKTTMIKMHDIVREVALSIASRDRHVFKIGRDVDLKWPEEDFLQTCLYIFLEWCHIYELPQRLGCPEIKYFCLGNVNYSLSIPDSFFEGMRKLKVLDLSRMQLPSLPKSFLSLLDLQALLLYECAMEDMRNIGALTNLQILRVYGSSMIRLPNELGQLTLLKMLDLTSSGIEIFPSKIISNLTKLEELYLGDTSIKWELENSVEDNKNATLAELRHLKNLTALEIQIQGAWVLPRDIMFEKLKRYKIVIGDIWEWSDNYGASKLLKLKLGTSIHLEYGIKELIKGVEDLYLDEINGISNVVHHLSGEGFPLLKHLHIQKNGEIQYIIKSIDKNTSHVFFPNLETLILQNLNSLKRICHGSLLINSFAKLKSIKVKCCGQLKYLFSVLMVKALSQLLEIEVSECNSMENIVFAERTFPSSLTIDDNIEFYSLRSLTLQHLPTIDDFYSHQLMTSTTTKQSLLGTSVPTSFFNAKVKFSYLETLKLSSINLEKIWDDGHLSTANSTHNLATLTVEDCSGLKNLFSSSMIASFPNLKQLEISKCDMMEEIIATEDRNSPASEEVGLSKLESVAIKNMKSLKKVWHFQFDGLKTLEVSNCEKLENIFPSDTQRIITFGSLETLKVSNCGSMEKIFELTANEIQSEEDITQVTQLKELHLLGLPKLKQIWSNKDPQGIFRFHNLQNVCVEDCGNIEYLFPFSIALDLPQLEKLELNECGMKEIVAKKEGSMQGKVVFKFDRLFSLVMWDMLALDRFYAGSHSITSPSLRELWVFNCPNLKLLGTQFISKQRKTQIPLQQPSFMIEEVIPNLEEWTLNNKEAIMILQDPQWNDHLRKLKVLRLYNFDEDKLAATFLDSVVQKTPNLKTLVVEHSSLKETFQDERVAYDEGRNEMKTKLEKLTLYSLQLQHICREGFQIDPILEVLEVLFVEDCCRLKFLVPSSVTFSHLTYLEIEKCNGLISIIYSSTATSLVKLETMKLKECNSLEEIVTQDMNETKDEIVFRSLKTLELECLPRLCSFSASKCLFRFLLLKKLVVRLCPRMKLFSEREACAPMLRKVIKDGEDEEWCWEGDLNATVKKIFLDKVAFRNSKHLDLSLYPELKDSWCSPTGHKMFCNLKSLVVKNCEFLSNVLISSDLIRALRNLEELEVADCDSVEAVFEINSTSEATHLRKITLSNMPKLQHIWKQGNHEIMSFGDSADVYDETLRTPKAPGKKEEDEVQIQHQQPLFPVSKVPLHELEDNKCEKPENTFPASMHKGFASLETLIVSDCNSLQEIFQLDDNDTSSAEVTTQLKNITLLRLPRLKRVWSRDPQSILLSHNLQLVHLDDCEDLECLFPFSIAMQLHQIENITIKRAQKMKYIVSNKEGPLDSPVKFEFHHLTSLKLWNLHELGGFYAGKYSLSCPSLKNLDVRRCLKLKLFNTPAAQGRVPDTELQLPTQLSLFKLQEVMCNLERLTLNRENASMILQGRFSGEQFCKLKYLHLEKFEDEEASFPYGFVQNITSLQELLVEFSCFKEIFQEDKPRDESGQIEIKTRLKNLFLFELHELEHICREGFRIDPVLEVLECLCVDQCSNLKHLVPSSVTSTHLTYLEVENCNGLIDLITSSTARSLVNLETLKLRNCKSLEEVVAEEREESEEEIAFSSLEIMELECLPMIKRFCSSKCFLNLPLLQKVIVKQCPRMEIFSVKDASTPWLQMILSEEEDGKQYWEGDLNRTINKMFVDKAIRERVEGIYKETSSNNTENRAPSKVDEIDDTRKQEIYKLQIPDPDIDPSTSQPPDDMTSSIQDAGKGIHSNENLLFVQGTSITDDNKETIGTKGMHETIERHLVQTKENKVSPTSVKDTATATQEMHESVDKPWEITIIQNKEESRDSDIHLSKNLFNQITISLTADRKEKESQDSEAGSGEDLFKPATMADNKEIGVAMRTREEDETSERPLVEAAKVALSPTSVNDAALDQSQDSEIHPMENSPVQTTTTTIDHNKESIATIGTKEMC